MLLNKALPRLKKVGVWSLALVATLAVAAPARAQKAEQIIARNPTAPDVDVDYPDEGDITKCPVKNFEEKGYKGVALYKPDGSTLLRVWAAPIPAQSGQKTTVEQIRFYKNGVEVYRDIIGKEARWFNTGGSRRASLGADKKSLVAWTVLSPQEATQEAVAALRTNDFPRYQRVALTADELKTLGITGSIGDELSAQVKGVTAAAFAELSKKLSIPATATWGALNVAPPAAVPASDSVAKDLDVCYNAAVVVLNGSGEDAQSQEIFIGDIVKVGNVWKIVGLPAGEPFGNATGAVAATSAIVPTSGENAVSASSADFGELGNALSEAYRKLETASPKDYPALCEQTVQLLLDAAEANPQERDNLLSQAVDVIFSGVQSGVYPGGAKKLADLADTLSDASQEVKARLRQRQITADYYAVSQAQPQPNARELTKAQEKYTEDLASFVEEFASTAAGAEAAMTLALDQEYMLENDGAIKYYKQAAQTAPNTPLGQKAAGAVARLQAEGGTLKAPAMQYFGGGACDLNALKGKPTVLFFWGSWDQPSINAVKAVASQVNVVGICADTAPDPESANAYFQQIVKTVPWKNVCDPAGLDGAVGTAFGIQTAPWVILLDKDGKVVRSNIVNLDELADIIKELK